MSNNENGNCDCEHSPKWLQILLTIAPAVLPVVVQKIADEISDFYRRKREQKKELETCDTPNNSTETPTEEPKQ